MKTNRTNGNCFYGPREVLAEIDHLKFAVSSLVELTTKGDYLHENLSNIARGINSRLDWLHDAVRIQAEERAKQ